MHAVTVDRPARAGVRPAPMVRGRPAARVALAALALATALSTAAYLGTPALAVVVALAGAGLATGWTSLLQLPSPRGTTTVVACSGALAAAAVGLTGSEPLLEWLAPALAAAVVGEFLHQLGRTDGRPRMVESVCGSVAGVVIVGSLASVVALPQSPVTAAGVLTWAVPVALALGALALPVPVRIAVPGGVLVAAVSGALLGGLLEPPTPMLNGARGLANGLGPSALLGPVAGAVAGAAAAAVAVMLYRLLAVLPRAGRTPGWLALAIAPLASSGLVGYVTLRLLAG